MMDQVIDGGRAWPCNVLSITASTIEVTMLGENGLNAVCSGIARNGHVDQGGRLYAVRLPGSFVDMNVTFNRT